MIVPYSHLQPHSRHHLLHQCRPLWKATLVLIFRHRHVLHVCHYHGSLCRICHDKKGFSRCRGSSIFIPVGKFPPHPALKSGRSITACLIATLDSTPRRSPLSRSPTLSRLVANVNSLYGIISVSLTSVHLVHLDHAVQPTKQRNRLVHRHRDFVSVEPIVFTRFPHLTSVDP